MDDFIKEKYLNVGKLRNWLANLFYWLFLWSIDSTQDAFEESICEMYFDEDNEQRPE
jgi:hypothetical protein